MSLSWSSIGFAASLLAFLAVSPGNAAEKTFGDLHVGEEAVLWLEDLCFDVITTKGPQGVPEGNTAVARGNVVRGGPNPNGPYAIVRGLKDGLYVEPQASDGSKNPDDGMRAYLAFTHSIGMEPNCHEPDGAVAILFGIAGQSAYRENMSVKQ